MALENYSDFQTLIADYLARDDLTSQIVDFIRLGEVRLGRDLRECQGNEGRATVTLVPGERHLDVPTDFIRARSLQINTNPIRFLDYKTPDWIAMHYAGNETNIPRVYSIVARTFKFGPAPDSDYEMEIIYQKTVEGLSDDNTTNWYTVNVPDMLLWASMIAAEPLIQNDTRLPMWKAQYDEGVQEYLRLDKESRYPGGTLVMTPEVVDTGIVRGSRYRR